MRFFAVALLLTLGALAHAQSNQYDILLKGGHVLDPKNDLDAIRDVAVRNGRIAAIGENLSGANARRTIDVSGLYVTPGLIDIHYHAFAGTDGRRCGLVGLAAL